MKTMKKNYKMVIAKWLILVVLLVIGQMRVYAGEEHFTNKIESCSIEAGAFFNVVDDKFSFMEAYPSTWQNEFNVKSSTGKVILKLDPTDKTIYSAFTVSANITVLYTNKSLLTSAFTTTLDLSYSPITGVLSTDQNVYHLPDVHFMRIKLNSITTNLGGNAIPNGLILKGEIDVERYYDFNYTQIPVIDHSIVDVESGTDRTMALEWPVVDGAEEYDLEWTFIDDYYSIGYLQSPDFKYNSTRVTIKDNYYEIPLVYEKGYILYRVRGVGRLSPDFEQRIDGAWSSEGFTYTTVNDYTDKYYVSAHESDNYNWGYQSFFTEDGVRGEGVSYFDGTLRNRQNISKLNTEDKIVVQETFYDYQGRPAISTLPAPYNSRTFKYMDNFNRNTSNVEFQASDFDDDNDTPELSQSYGAGEYYSTSNTDQDEESAYIPDADGFPFTRTEYMNDQTGRIRRQGGLGEDHQLDSDKESKFFYGNPSQYKLTKLFGTDVGYNSSYKETMVIDPNGQASVSVTDASGRVIITNLAGKAPDNLEELDSYSEKEKLTVSIIDNTMSKGDKYGSFISTQSYIAKAEGVHTLTYSVIPEVFDSNLASGVCFDCVYELSISIVDNEDGTEMIPSGPYIDTIGILPPNVVCNSVDTFTIDTGVIAINLPIGSYTITKELSINTDAIDYYVDYYMDNNVSTYHDFLSDYMEDVDSSTCNMDYCSLQCVTELGGVVEWLAENPGQDSTDYQDALDECMEDCNTPMSMCDMYYNRMLLDVSKGGQYGLYDSIYHDETADTMAYFINVTAHPLSVFNVNNELPANWNYSTAGTGANWTNPNGFYRAPNDTSHSKITVVDTSGSGDYDPEVRAGITPKTAADSSLYVYPEELKNVDDFLDYWQSSWADSLVAYHPEYCYLDFVCTNDPEDTLHDIFESNAFDQAMLMIQDYETAEAAGYLNPLSQANLASSGPVPDSITHDTIDPFYNYLPSSDRTDFKNDLKYFYDDGVTKSSIWDVAYAIITCSTCSTATQINNNAGSYGDDPCTDDLVWRQFRELYLAKKSEFFDLQMSNYAIENGCFNGCIGKDDFAGTDFSFDCYPKTISPACTLKSSNYDGYSDTVNGTDLDQPCNSADYELYAEKTKVFTTAYDDYVPSEWPVSEDSVAVQDSTALAEYCEDRCEYYADGWIAQLSKCGMSASDSTNMRAEFIELCELQCDPDSDIDTTSNGNGTVEEVIIEYLGAGYENDTCNSLLLIQPEVTFFMDDKPIAKLDTCGCTKVLQNEYNFDNVTLPNGVSTADDLFYYDYGFVPDNYSSLVCACDTSFQTDGNGGWDPGDSWGSTAVTTLATVDMSVVEDLSCGQCLSCTEIGNAQDDFDTDYDFYDGDDNYYGYFTTYLNRLHGYNFSPAQVEEFVNNCDSLIASSLVWEQSRVGADLEALLNNIVKTGNIFSDSASPLDLTSSISDNSLKSYTSSYEYWTSILPTDSNRCSDTLIYLKIGEVDVDSCTITLNLSDAINDGYDFGFCDIISLSNLTHTGTSCSNKEDFYMIAKFFQGTTINIDTIYGTSTCYPIANCYDDTSEITICNVYGSSEDNENECLDMLISATETNAKQAYVDYYEESKLAIMAELKDKCMAAKSSEKFDMTYWDQEYHYTLYYYDQAGNLVQTIPPAGVKPFANPSTDVATADSYRDNNSGTKTPPHTVETRYRYNSYNQLTEQSTPDAGVANYWYDIAGRLVVSQNARQAGDDDYSYTIYDDYGRISEVGELYRTEAITKATAEDPDDLTTWINNGTKTEITKTFYDETLSAGIDAYFDNGQENLRLRVATVAYYATDVANTAYDNAIHYSYDIAGNVKEAIMEDQVLHGINTTKHLSYQYDLISGNVNQVIFQEGETDQYYHQYHYDLDNRIHEVLTSQDGVIWEKDAKYFYYKHGPLARIELGDEKVQGIDLAYTIQGWLKGVNSNTLKTNRDIGKDAGSDYLSSVPELHQSVAKDAFGYTLNYFNGDYSAISAPTAANHFEATVTSTPIDVTNTSLYNGNIRNMVTAIEGMDIYGNVYKYDQLNRLGTSTVFDGVNETTNTWTGSSSMSEYLTDIDYDANGNILTLNRKGNTTINMDDLDYFYYTKDGMATYQTPAAGVDMSNKLAYVTDGYTDGTQNDYTGGSSSLKFEYDELGNLIKDPVEEIDDIEWTVYGKVRKITRTSTSSKSDLEFGYDAMGNRIKKVVKPRSGSGLYFEKDWTYSYYRYDAGGNLLAIYEKTFTDLGGGSYKATLKQKEVNLYGSNRLGIDERNKTIAEQEFTAGLDLLNKTFTNISVTSTTYPSDDANLVDRILGDKSFELSNHLGNVLATVSDKKLGVSADPANTTATSGFEGNDYDLFSNGDYSSQQSTVDKRNGTYSVKLSYPSDEYGPRMEIPISEGDVVDVSVYAKYGSGTSSGKLIIGLIDACTGSWTKVSGGSTQWFADSTTTTDTWIQLSHSYTVASNLEAENVVLVIQLWNSSSSGDTYFDDLDVDVTYNNNQTVSYTADIKTRQMYYPFGMVMPNSDNLNAGTYRYGMNGMERDNEVKGNGNSYTSYWRQYDPRLGRWLSDEPKPVAWESGYAAFRNNPIYYDDPHGDFAGADKLAKAAGEITKGIASTGFQAGTAFLVTGKTFEFAVKGGGGALAAGSVLKTAAISSISRATIGGDDIPEYRAIYYPSAVDFQIEPGDASVQFLGAAIEDVFFQWTHTVADAVRTIADPEASTEEKVVSSVNATIAVIFSTTRSKSGPMKLKIAPENKIARSKLNPPIKKGAAPTFKKDGTSVEIHHDAQNPNGPFKEMHWKEHRGKGNYKKNHPNKKGLTPKERKEFNKARKQYWSDEYYNDF